MKHFFAIFILLLLILLISTQAGVAQTDNSCAEGERRVCGVDIGICKPGRSICRNGNWTECNGEVRPQEKETCGNRLDDNCNGATDEDCFPWISLVLVGIGIFFIGIGMYYMQRGKNERLIREGVSKD